ncbi:TonB-dependent receptor [Asticcacaulis machinosus]|uniref:TonB-dependent receptor n=1 Tax=Asticcacaulis machinosus TaxID=2984211 RepID=A0ABT5HHG2_9CAUL|nr:TonB-dependent receptor [Asticcacaulis machinosus]MDC7675595.1 TonB-dependent receptor [Asticcacaulis machinosus]
MVRKKSRASLMRDGVSVAALAMVALTSPAFSQAQAVTGDVEATAPADDGVTVVVTARRKALQSATERKKNSDTLIDSVVADDAGKLPDNSITEVLQRVSGVTMVRFAALNNPDAFSVEGSGIQVRGLSGVTATLNGREVFSANGGGGLSWGDVTPELMAAVDVYKASRADMIEGGTGGTVDLRTKMPFDYKNPSVEGAIGASYGDKIKKTTGSASILFTDRWDTSAGEIGLLVDLAFSEFSSEANFLRAEPYYKRDVDGQARYLPGGFTYGDNQFNRERTGFYEAFQWKPNDQWTFFQTAFVSEYKNDDTAAGVFVTGKTLVPDMSGNVTFDANGGLISADRMYLGSNGYEGWRSASGTDGSGNPFLLDCNTPFNGQAQGVNWSSWPPTTCSPDSIGVGSSRNFATSETVTRDFSQGFTWNPTDQLRVQGALQFVDSSAKSTNFGLGLNSTVFAYSVDLRGDLPQFVIESSDRLENKANYGWDNIAYRTTNNHGTMGAVNLDVDYAFDEGFFTTLEAGVRYADRVERDNFDGTYWAALGRGWNGSSQRTLNNGAAEDTELYDFGDFFRGEANLPALFWLPSAQLMQSNDAIYAQSTYGYDQECLATTDGSPQFKPDGTCTIDNPDREPLANVYHDPYGASRTQVTTTAFYVQGKFRSDSGLFGIPYTGNIGVRVVKNEVESSGFFSFGDNQFYLSQAEANADLADDGLANNYYETLNTGENRTGENDYIKVLPSFNINFKPTDQFYLRFAANQTMSPPGYGDIRSVGSAGVSLTKNTNDREAAGPVPAVDFPDIFNNMTANTGNPTLKPTMSKNVDFSAEWYPSNSLNVHFALFYKKLDDLIVYGDTTKPFSATFTRLDGTVTTVNTTQTTSEVYNAKETAKIKGLEIGGRKFFDELPAPWNGLGIEANYTYIDSSNPSAKALDINGQLMDDVPIVGMSKDNYNVQLMYEKDALSVRLAYSWRSEYLQSTNSNGTNGDYTYYQTPAAGGAPIGTFTDISLPVYADAYGQFDLGVNYKISEKIRFWVQANNLTNETTRTLMGGYPGGQVYTRSWFVTDRRINLGFNLAF